MDPFVLARLLLPARCAACSAWGQAPLCDDCERSVRWIASGFCERCGRPRDPHRGTCSDCARRVFAFDRARAVAIYEGPARELVKAFKLLGERRLGREMAHHMADVARPFACDVVTWVPSTRRSEVERGFNPAEVLARPLGRALRMPVRALLEKRHRTADQAGLTRGERATNLRGAFLAKGRVPGRVLVVDDIFTTGATAHECAAALKAKGARDVSVVTFARAL